MIGESEAPDFMLELQPAYDFEHLLVNCMPLTGLTYKIDARKMHQLIRGFVQGETAKTWIKPKYTRQDGCLDYLALLAHYKGEDNKAAQIKEAEALQTSLIYKN